MATPAANPQIIRFGAYEVDLRTGELRKHGLRIKLQEQPFQILAMLVERPGELVTREQIKERLWPSETFVDFDHSVNTAIRRLRDALSDSADNPRYVETLPRRGYRFIAAVQSADIPESPKVVSITSATPSEEAAPAIVPGGCTQPTPFPAPTAVAVAKPQRTWLIPAITAILAISAIAAILLWRFWPQPASIDSVAVLPFTTVTGDPELDYLSEGLAESIIDNLSELPQLKVMSRNSAFQYRTRPNDVRAVGKSLGVGALVLGSIQKSGEKLRITVELVDARDDRHLWGNQWEVWITDMANLQHDVSAQISQSLRQRLTAEVQAHLAQRQTRSGLAYIAYLRGRYALNSRKNENFRRALQYFQDAIDADPNYALAYSGMSTAYGLMSFYGGMNAYEALKLSESAADRALQLDPSLADGHISRGFIIENLHRNLPAAEREMRRAIDLSPKSADAHHALALVLADQGKFDEAIAESRRSEELDPLWPGNRSTTGWIYYDARRYDDALRVLNLFAPEFGPAHWSRGLTYVALGRYQEAVHEFETADASSALYKSQKAHAYAVMGRTADARKLLAEILAERQRGYVSPANIAGIYAGLNEPQAALHWLHIADLECDSWLQRVRFDPRFDRLRSLPDFQQILESITTPR